jgi:hypothetical protein
MSKTLSLVSALALLVGVALVMLPLAAHAQLTYNQFFMLKNVNNGAYCAIDIDGGSNPFRCDNLVSSPSLVTLSGNNSPFILNNSYIVNNSIPAIINGGTTRWCYAQAVSAYGASTNLFCSYTQNRPFFQIRKRADLGGSDSPYVWPGDYVNVAFTRYTPNTYCGVPIGGSIIQCDFNSTSDASTLFQILY